MKYFAIDEDEHFLALTFSAPGTANAFSVDAAREIIKILKKYKTWTKPVVVKSGHPSVFCSGGNLNDYRRMKTKAEGLKTNREITKSLNEFAKWRPAKLAIVTGDCLGGGMEWLARFDFRWATPGAMFSFWQRRIGLSTGWGGGEWWARALGESRVRQLLLEAEWMTAQTAKSWGLVDRVLPLWKVDTALRSWSQNMDHPVVSELTPWQPNQEAKVFNRLWLGPYHASVLKSWRR